MRVYHPEMDIKSFAGWWIGPSGGPTDIPARAAIRPISPPRPPENKELSPAVPTLIAWVSCVFSPTTGQNLNDFSQLVAALRATTYCLNQV